MKEYEGFSKQDLLDRKEALLSECVDIVLRKVKLDDEIWNINKLLEE